MKTMKYNVALLILMTNEYLMIGTNAYSNSVPTGTLLRSNGFVDGPTTINDSTFLGNLRVPSVGIGTISWSSSSRKSAHLITL